MDKKLFRSSKDKVVSGVIGGLAEYSGIDVSLLRVCYILLLVFTGLVPMLFVYILWAAVVPLNPEK